MARRSRYPAQHRTCGLTAPPLSDYLRPNSPVGSNKSLHAPGLIDIEVAHTLRTYALKGELTEARGQSALVLLQRFPLTRHAHAPLLNRIWMLRYNLAAYDAPYVALAEGLDATLYTRDTRLARSAGHSARIELI